MMLNNKVLRDGGNVAKNRLTDLTGARWRVAFSGVESVPAEKITDLFRHDPAPHMSARLDGRAMPLHFLLIFPEWSVSSLTQAFSKGTPRLRSLPDLDCAAVGEVANIVGGGIIRSIADDLGRTIILSTPSVSRGSKSQLIGTTLAESRIAGPALLTDMQLYSDQMSASSTVVLLMGS